MTQSLKRILIPTTFILGILIISTITTYIYQFANTPLSESTSNWGSFGDYIGGILNPIISLASLIILSYLTYLVSLQSNKENKKLAIYQRRLSAYDELTKHLRPLNLVLNKVKLATQFISQIDLLAHEKKTEMVLEMKKEISSATNAYTEFYITLQTFKVQYGHLFEYNFDSNDFEQLKEYMRQLGDQYNSVGLKLFNNEEKEKFY